MSFLVIGTDRFLLQIGDNTLGGTGPDAVPAEVLRALPPTAVIVVVPGQTATIRNLGKVPALIDGAPLAGTAVALRHGARLEIGEVRLVYGELALNDRTAHTPAIDATAAPGLPDIATPEATADTGGRLTSVGSGAVYAIPPAGLRIGRDPSCDIVVASAEASRDHAFVAPTLLGYMITDRSTNGVFVNGRRVKGAQLLAQRDVVRICWEELRFEADAANFELDATRLSNEAAFVTSAETKPPVVVPPTKPARKDPPTAELPSSKPLLATMEVLNTGQMNGMRFRIERSSVQIGRGIHNDIRLPDDSVSGSHATLVQEGPIWKLLDLDSTNGTYVDGKRIARDAELRGPADLRFGNIKVLFRPIARGADPVKRTRVIV